MRYSTLRRKLSEHEAGFRRWDDYRTEPVNGCADDSSVCSCSESSLNEDDNNAEKVDFREYGFTVFDVPEELREQRRRFEKTETVECKRDGGRREKVWGSVGSYYGVLISGAAFGVVSMGVLMVRFSGCFHHVDYLGALTPT